MSLFDSFKTKDSLLERLVGEISSNMANNYKDAAQAAYKELIDRFEEMKEAGKLNEKQRARYEAVISSYSGKLKGYSHKDQKPYWASEK
ncbi:MAG: hypothetical protein MJ124_01405 [Lachnospiraceae bacterium]|nr:hypothetical protein [Lachnospiraceae bacterium]